MFVGLFGCCWFGFVDCFGFVYLVLPFTCLLLVWLFALGWISGLDLACVLLALVFGLF